MKDLLHKQRLNRYKYKDLDIRKRSLKKLYAQIERNEDALFEAFKIDLGKSKFETYTTEIGYIKNSITHYLKHMDKWLKQEKVKTPIYLFGSKSSIIKEQLGQILVISSFNYPFQLLFEPLIGAIVSGNTVVLKPSEFVPNINVVIKRIIEASFDLMHVQIYEGDKEVTQELLKHKFDKIFFTGSEKVGRIVYEAAAKTLAPVILELGGKSPAIVYEDANLDVIVNRIVWGKFMNAGQTCVAPDYVLVEEGIKDVFINKLAQSIKEMYPTTQDYGKIVSKHHIERLENLLRMSNIPFDRSENRIFKPIITELKNTDNPLMHEEIFGPILPVLSFKESPIDIVEKFPTPLALYVFTEDKKKAANLIESIPSGGAVINHTMIHLSNPNLPFGGQGTSGIGMYHGKYSIDAFTHKKAVMSSSTRFEHRLLYPPYNKRLKLIKRILK